MTTDTSPATPAARRLAMSLWIAQGLLALTFVGGGIWKIVTPLPELAAMIPWAGQVPAALLWATAIADLLGGLGVILPSITRILPGLTALAALGCATLQACAVAFHLARGEAANTPFNVLLFALSLFVAWGRRPRTHADGPR